MSRPTSTVPRMWPGPGGRSREAGASRVGLWVESTPANRAASTKTRRMSAPATTLRLPRRGGSRPTTGAQGGRRGGGAAPATTLWLPRSRRSQRGRVDAAAAGPEDTRTSTAASLIADPRIDEGVEKIHPEIDQDIDGGRHEHHSLHHGIVASQNGRDDEPAQPRDIEHDLRDDGAADEHGGGDADHRDHGHEGVAEGVDPGDHA